MEFNRAINIKDAISSAFLNKATKKQSIISFHAATNAAALTIDRDTKNHVNGVGIGAKSNGENYIKVLTREKPKVNHRYFSQFYGVAPNDIVIETVGPIRLKMPTNNHRPPYPGISVGHYRITAGTLGCFVEDNKQKVYILSNNHVLANSNRGYWKDPILQPGALDGGTRSRDIVGTLSYMVELQYSSPNEMDAALAEVVPDLKTDYRIARRNRVKGITAPTYEMKVEKFGRTTGYTKGKITTTNLDLQVDFDGQLIDFQDQFEVKGNNGTMFCDGGDSGSLIIDRNSQSAVGLLFAGTDDGTTFATPIKEILDAFSVKIL